MGAVPRRHRAVRERDHPEPLRRPDADGVLQAPDRHRARSCGTSASSASRSRFKRNPFYWQKGKPYLDSVTWKFVTDENTRELQLRGGQIQVDEFPPFNSITKLQHTLRGDDDAVPVDPHGLSRHEREVRAARRRARASRDLLRDRPRRRSSSRCCSASASPPTRSCRRRCRSTSKATGGLQFDMAKAKAEMAKSKYPKGFKVTLLVGAGAQVEDCDGSDPPATAEAARDQRDLQAAGHVAPSSRHPEAATTSSRSATGRWTSPTRTSSSRSRSIRSWRRALVLHRLQQPDGDRASRTRRSGRRTSRSGRSSTRSSSRSPRTTRSSGFLYYSPFR